MASSSRFFNVLVQYFIFALWFYKTIRYLALDFYEVTVDLGFALVKYQLIEISSSNC
jgi:hypothetical protein